MSIVQSVPETLTASPPVASAAEAAALTAHLNDVMDALVDVVQQETEFVRGGRLSAATKLEKAKADLARLYIADTLKLRASHTHLSQIVPDMLEALRQRHDSFRGLLQLNLTVLATAHAVSEGIVRGVSGELARKSAPQTYGASGRSVTPGAGTAQPLAVSRTL